MARQRCPQCDGAMVCRGLGPKGLDVQAFIDWLFGTYEGVAVLVGAVLVICITVVFTGGGGKHRR